MIACSISAPLKPSDTRTRASRSNCSGSPSLGRSTKKISSNRPLRSSSGGKLLMSLLVAMTKTGAVFSCIQTRKLPNTRAAVPASDRFELAKPAIPFSSSSNQSTQGLTDSANWSATRMFCSDKPTISLKTLPISRRSRGSFHSPATDLATSDLPPPWTPSRSRPRGSGRPNRRARSLKAKLRVLSQALSSAIPPT